MRPGFSDGVVSRARKTYASDEGKMTRWWCQKYNLPPNHELLQTRSLSDLEHELLVDMLHDRDQLRRQLDEGGSDAQQDAILQRINGINQALGDPVEDYDPLVAKWEAELERGVLPDLDEEV